QSPGMYNFAHMGDYRYAACNEPVVDCPIKLKDGYEDVAKTPYGIRLLFDLAYDCVSQRFKNWCRNKGKMLLWVSVSGTDKIGHLYGPDSYEVTDMFYHLDKELQRFMISLTNLVSHRRTLFILTADHGAAPIPELVEEQGIWNAHRILEKPLLE